MRHTTIDRIREKLLASEDFLIIMLGDSITRGSCASTPEHTYTAQLAKGLGERMPKKTVLRYDGEQVDELLPLGGFGEAIPVQKGSKSKLTVVKCGVGGNTVRRMLNRQGDYAGRAFEGRIADLFFLNVGINDSLWKDPSKYATTEQYQKDLRELIDLLGKTNPEADLIFMTPTYHHDGKTADSDLTPYAEAMKEVAREEGIPCIDLHQKWMNHMIIGGEGNGQGDWLKCDKCHPSDRGHRVMAEQILEDFFPNR